jgi:hypothetical protein
VYHFWGKYLGIHLHAPSKHPQQLIWHLLNSKLVQDESLINNQHFIKRAHPHRMIGSKVPEF